MQLFGYSFKRRQEKDYPSFAPDTRDDGAVVVAAGGNYGTYFDLDGTVRTDAELVTKYREMTMNPEIDAAITNIVNDAIVNEEEMDVVDIVLDKIDENLLPAKIKEILTHEFNEVLDLLSFRTHCYEIFSRWYIDGRLYYHAIVDPEHPEDGIQELRYVDPRKIRKVREIAKKKSKEIPTEGILMKTAGEYFIYNDKGFANDPRTNALGTYSAASGLRIAVDSIVHVTSGLLDARGVTVLSYLHKAIKPLNQLRMLEDAVVIYRLSRAPERRIFYVDVGTLPKLKAEQYLRDMMQKHKNRLVYDGATGEIRDDRKFMTMWEDYWFPRRSDGRATDVQTLPAGENLGQIEDVRFFQKRLYKSLGVPVSRLDEESQGFSLGRTGEITRDEVNFSRFIDRLRSRFSVLFLEVMKKQVVLKRIMSIEDWEKIASYIIFRYSQDNYFSEVKEAEIMQNRLDLLEKLQEYAGMYFSHYYIRTKYLRQDDDDIAMMDSQIEEEMNDPRWNQELQLDPDEAYEPDGSTTPGEDIPPPGNDGSPTTTQDKKKVTAHDKVKQMAIAMGLKYAGFGRWANSKGKVTHVEKQGVLVKGTGKRRTTPKPATPLGDDKA